ncbi:hypothetical protein OY671_007048, partial [Metschnikowia pulcherrima]
MAPSLPLPSGFACPPSAARRGGGHVVRRTSAAWERAAASLARRRPRRSFHAASGSRCDGLPYVVEMTPAWGGPPCDRGVVVTGPVGSRPSGRSRWFRYEVRCWAHGAIPDREHAVGPPVLVTRDAAAVARISRAVRGVPPLTWGRRPPGGGEMWNSNSLVAWSLARAGLATDHVPPGGGPPPPDRRRPRRGRTPVPPGRTVPPRHDLLLPEEEAGGSRISADRPSRGPAGVRPMIQVEASTKRYGPTTAVDRSTFTARPGTVTGFLGPNGAGKSTTMRVVVGSERPTSGTATVDGRRYADSPAPSRAVGVMLDARSVHPGRTAFRHSTALARTHGIGRARVDEVIGMTGLESVAGRRAGTFSLGMGQRLGIAGALLGDPGTLVLDEPVNGSDPDGVSWVRGLVRGLAAEGRAVSSSSHLMHELASCADRVVVIGQGRSLADAPVQELAGEAGSLEEAYSRLTADAVQYRGRAAGETGSAPAGGPRPASAGGPTLPRAVAAEWTRSTSSRSSWWAAALTVAVSAVSTYLSAQASSVDPGFDPLGSLTSGSSSAQVPPLVLGVLVGTGEYSTGTFRTTFVAEPRRWPVLVGQTAATAAFASLTAALAVGAAVLASSPSARARGLALDLGRDGTPQVLVGMTLSLAGMASLGLALGALVRRPVPALTAAVLVVLVSPVALVSAADSSGDPLAAPAGVSSAQAAVNTVVTFLPTGAASSLTGEGAVEGAPDSGAVGGGLVLAAWVLVPLASAAVRSRTRDVVTSPRVLAAEWDKSTSSRSTAWLALATVAAAAGTAWASGAFARPDAGSSGAPLAVAGSVLAQLGFLVLGAGVGAGEFRTGTARVTFAAVPRR